jgi:hypothetical protein
MSGNGMVREMQQMKWAVVRLFDHLVGDREQ